MEVVSTVAGQQKERGVEDGPLEEALFDAPVAVTIDNQGRLFITELEKHSVRMITSKEVITIAGKGYRGCQNGIGTEATFTSPKGIVINNEGILWIADSANSVIRKLTPFTTPSKEVYYEVTTVSGSHEGAGHRDGVFSEALFEHPTGIALDQKGNIYVAEANLSANTAFFSGNQTIRKLSVNGTVSTVAGVPRTAGTRDGVGTHAMFSSPTGLIVCEDGSIFVCDSWNHTIRKINKDGVVTTFAGISQIPGLLDGPRQSATFKCPRAIALSPTTGDLIVVCRDANSIRRIRPDGIVETIAGGQKGYRDGWAFEAMFDRPLGVAIDSHGDIYIADTDNNVIRKISVVYWTPSTHRKFPREIKKEIRTVMMLSLLRPCTLNQLPMETLVMVCQFVATKMDYKTVRPKTELSKKRKKKRRLQY